MDKPIYIHYGCTKFNPSINFPIRNRELSVKPKGGLWASRIDASFGWKNWCREEDFYLPGGCDIENSFRFRIKDGKIVHQISTIEQLEALPIIETKYWPKDYYIDFEACLKRGISAIELCWYGDEWGDISSGNLHYALYGWDCDSIVILDPDAVEVIS